IGKPIFSPKNVWIMEYNRDMGFGYDFPANQLGGNGIVWIITEYGFIRIWIITEST
ncbi:hypothetical protein CPC08DRAFT_595666, partial [Agrocybe pediades]